MADNLTTWTGAPVTTHYLNFSQSPPQQYFVIVEEEKQQQPNMHSNESFIYKHFLESKNGNKQPDHEYMYKMIITHILHGAHRAVHLN